jgi:DNA-binding transcriptional ArsR family regulator
MLSIPESDIGLLEKKASQAADTLKSLSNKWRLLILCQLVKGEKSVGELLEIIDLSQSALSQHLAVLREADLVSTRRESQSIYYFLKGDEVSTILAALYQVYCAPSGTPAKSGKARRKG